MSSEILFFTDKCGQRICFYKWLPLHPPKVIVQIVHGMAEHAARYGRLAEYLTEREIAVFANDHRGHGLTVANGNSWGVLADSDGFTKMIDDEKEFTALIKANYPDIPVVLLGHSMGSFICRHYIADDGHQVDGVILSGTGSHNYLDLISGMLISLIQSKVFGKNSPARFLDKLIFSGYNKSFAPNRTAFDWLSRDESEVDKYIADPKCGNVFPAGFYLDFFKALLFLKMKKSVLNIAEKLPVFIFSGADDPVGDKGKGVMIVYDRLKKRGLTDLELLLYPGGRHEMLNETNRLDVMENLARWIKKRYIQI